MTRADPTRGLSHRSGDALACLLLVALFTAWYWPGVFGGRVYFDEDVAANFFSWRSSLYALAHGGEWSWWEPLTGLGIPRFGNILVGYFSPVSLLFYWVPTATAYGLYPTLVMSLLACLTYALFRVRGLVPVAALFGAVSWSGLSGITTHLQHPSYIETILWLPATLLAWQLYARSRSGIWAAAAGLGLAFQCFGASPQYLLYNFLVMGAWIGLTFWEQRNEPRDLGISAIAACGVVVAGLGLASWQLLPALEFSAESHRSLLYATQAFADHYRAAPHEIALGLAAETFLVMEAPPLAHGGGLYRNVPNLSLVTVVFALGTLFTRPRRLFEWAVALFFLAGMLGSAGGVTTLIETFFPFAERLRAPMRMLVPAAFWISWLAACGMHAWLQKPARMRQAIGLAAIAWLVLLGWTLRRPTDQWVPPAFFEVPEAIRGAEGRIAVDIVGATGVPLFAINAGLGAGTRTLMTREALWPRNFWEAIYASQFGSLEHTEKVDRIVTAAVLPLYRPALPLLRSYGLRSVVRYTEGEYLVLPVPNPVADVFLAPHVRVAVTPPERWELAASMSWDPTQEAIVAREIPGVSAAPDAGGASSSASSAEVRRLADSPDSQVVEVDSDGGILVTSGLFYPGWTVRVDGDPAEALEVNFALRGVAVPAGRHRVRWDYRPTWFFQAVGASAVGLVALLGLAIGLRAPRNGSRTAPT